jgi:hypothetical protein
MNFRIWLTERWLEHAEEILAWTGTPPKYTAKDYFQKYKWWLRREYQHQFKKVK